MVPQSAYYAPQRAARTVLRYWTIVQSTLTSVVTHCSANLSLVSNRTPALHFVVEQCLRSCLLRSVDQLIHSRHYKCLFLPNFVFRQEKQHFFRSSSLKNKVSICGRLSMTPPQTQTEAVDYESLFGKLSNSLERFQSDLNTIDQSAAPEDIEFQLRVSKRSVCSLAYCRQRLLQMHRTKQRQFSPVKKAMRYFAIGGLLDAHLF